MNSDDTQSTETSMVPVSDSQESVNRSGPAPISDRYGAIILFEDTSIIYDQHEPEMWIQSDAACPIDEMK